MKSTTTLDKGSCHKGIIVDCTNWTHTAYKIVWLLLF